MLGAGTTFVLGLVQCSKSTDVCEKGNDCEKADVCKKGNRVRGSRKLRTEKAYTMAGRHQGKGEEDLGI